MNVRRRYTVALLMFVTATRIMFICREAIAKKSGEDTCVVSDRAWYLPNLTCEAVGGIPPVSDDVAKFYTQQMGKQLGPLSADECPFDVLYGSKREDLFRLSFSAGTVTRQGKLYSSGYYTDDGKRCSEKESRSLLDRLWAKEIPTGLTRTLYVVDLQSRFYAVDVCEGEKGLRALIDMPPDDVSLAAKRCRETGYSDVGAGLERLRVVHSSILGHTEEQIANVGYRSGGATRTLLISGNVLGAGHIFVKDGKVTAVTNCSGHFKPPISVLKSNIDQLVASRVAAGPIIDDSYYVLRDESCAIVFFTTHDSKTESIYKRVLDSVRRYLAFPIQASQVRTSPP